MPDRMDEELDAVEKSPNDASDDPDIGPPAGLTCPECHGSLFEIREGELVRYRCRVGHAFSSETLQAEQLQYLETALWTALRALEENAALTRRMMERSERFGHTERVARYRDQLREVEMRAEQIRLVLRAGPVDSVSLTGGRTA
jgi:two-component system chemotaxis response regulator CheB